MRNIAFLSSVLFLGLSLVTSAYAYPGLSLTGDSQFQVMPIVGYETAYRDSPTPHTSTSFVYGLRLSYGVRALSGEAEYTHGKDTENFDTAPEKIVNEDDKLKLGLRSTAYLGDYVFLTGRAGGQASQGKVTETSGGVDTTENKDLKIYPYAGAALGVHLGSFLTISAGTTVVFTNSSSMKENEIQNTIALSVGIN